MTVSDLPSDFRFSDKEYMVARVVLNSNRQWGAEYVHGFSNRTFSFRSRAECLAVLDAVSARDFICVDISPALNAVNHGGAHLSTGGKDVPVEVCARTNVEDGLRYVKLRVCKHGLTIYAHR